MNIRSSLRHLCVLCVSVVKDAANTHHRDAESTEVAQRRSVPLATAAGTDLVPRQNASSIRAIGP